MNIQAHEAKVARFYGTGIDGFHDYHKGYLNFGLWDRPGMGYLEAAENLVRATGVALGLTQESELLDVGCGMGTQDLFLHETFQPRSIDAIDITAKHVERSQERLRGSAISPDRLRFHLASGVRLPFANASFTHVLSVEAPEHFETREAFFQEAFRVLRPGGVLVITDYCLGRPPRTPIDRALVRLVTRMWCVPQENVYVVGVFEEKLRKAGFDHVRISDLSASVIPGYYKNAGEWDSLRGMIRVRGFVRGVIGGRIIDHCLIALYRMGLCDYLLVRAQKPEMH